jgi:hypothetical protein
VRDVETGAVRVDAPNEQPTASDDDESLNVCASDEQVKQQRLRDLADESMDEAASYIVEWW